MNPTANKDYNSIEPTIRTLGQLSPRSQEMAASLVRQLAEREGINVPFYVYLARNERVIPLYVKCSYES